MLCALIANVLADREGHKEPYAAQDFFPGLKPKEEPAKPETPYEHAVRLETSLAAIARQFNQGK